MRLIDADALKERAIRASTVKLPHTFFKAVGTREIDKAPTIDAEPVKRGRWETANDGTHFCPHCGCDAPYTWDDIDRNFMKSADDVPDRPSNYCPNCGARMDGGKEA